MYDLPAMLEPIPGDNPAGVNLRYDAVFDRVREARREEEVFSLGEWGRQAKAADFDLVRKLTGEALATRSKDLQLAAWYAEAELRLSRFRGLANGLRLIDALLDRFWDHLYPEIEDGDLELRAVPLEWLGTRLHMSLYKVPLTRAGYGYLHYTESRRVPAESEAADGLRRELREDALRQGKITPEAFDTAVAETAAGQYGTDVEEINSVLSALEVLEHTCLEHFGEADCPSFSVLRQALEQVSHFCDRIRREKARLDEHHMVYAPIEASAAAEVKPEPVEPAPPAAVQPMQPTDRWDAVQRVVAAAEYLRREDPFNPFPYAALRALRWGELKAAGQDLDFSLLEAPPSSVRQELKRLSAGGQWLALLEATEKAMAQEYGRSWLDLQRHTARACENLGPSYEKIRTTVIGEVRSLLAEFPQLVTASLLDDTPTANHETQLWIRTEVTCVPEAPAGPPEPSAPPDPEALISLDALPRAMDEAANGNPEVGVRLLSAAIVRQPSARRKFTAKVQLAHFCHAIGYHAMARSVLNELVAQIDAQHLEQWESPEELARIFALLYSVLEKSATAAGEREAVYARICQLDPAQAPPR